MNKQKKSYKGEKYIYLLMAFRLAEQNLNSIKIGNDNGMVGGNQFERFFKIQKYDNKVLLVETKSSKGFADFSRTFEVIGCELECPTICDYMNEYGENCGQEWVH